MRNFKGKHYEDISGSQPPQEAVADTEQAEVQVPPRPGRGDRWEVRGEWLVRVHSKMRLSLFLPSRAAGSPVPEAALTGQRVTLVKIDGRESEVNDNFRTVDHPERRLLERWSGETRFKIDSRHPSQLRPPGQPAPGASARARSRSRGPKPGPKAAKTHTVTESSTLQELLKHPKAKLKLESGADLEVPGGVLPASRASPGPAPMRGAIPDRARHRRGCRHRRD